MSKFVIESGVLAKFLSKEFKTVKEEDFLNALQKYHSTKRTDKSPKHFASPAAEKLATENNLTPEDFEERTGRKLKNGFQQICITDVRKKLNIYDDLKEKAFTTPKVYEFALANNLSPSDFNVSGKIRKTDVEALIKLRETA